MLKPSRLAYAIALPLLISGCQSCSLKIQPVAVQTGTGSMVHGGARAELAPVLAQRVIDQGLIALAVCQAYVREVKRSVAVEKAL